ncbi:hypothetical protein AALP_AA7G110100 [Arabis alpina]|uniref:Uncharacterized protein n=1 Tax=Arabis alpina TaxID=50452 RepID=A0A087GHA9_ARAAL|nr:hypothetical protein AALP_AA7G110100 [Arabis alpina]
MTRGGESLRNFNRRPSRESRLGEEFRANSKPKQTKYDPSVSVCPSILHRTYQSLKFTL